MAVGVGVIGAGVIGKEHIRRIEAGATARVAGVASRSLQSAERLTAGLQSARSYADPLDLIASDDVNAVLITSPVATHAPYVVEAIKASKPVFCEKPLAVTADECRLILDAEVAAGRRLVQVGFMRRFDIAYLALKAAIDSGELGDALIYYSSHRIPAAPAGWQGSMALVDAAPHDFDIARWLLGADFATVRVMPGRSNRNSGALRDPLVTLLETTTGQLVFVETSMNVGYGYDIGGEVVAERGTATLERPGRNPGGAPARIPRDWRERFAAAFDAEIAAWLAAVSEGSTPVGPSSWDGYAAQVASEAAVRSLTEGQTVAVSMIERPTICR
jgi:myo-inositol 2-dehydrogenase/D-chiro-inositol 1-dehydrogenase